MKTWYFAFALSMFLSCGSSDDSFRMEGRFNNINQGELYLFSLDNEGKDGMDTIRVANGKFRYEKQLEDTLVMMMIFPNYSEIPVIAEPGATVKVEGDVSHLKEVEVTGTDDNELLTGFRLSTNELTPPKVLEAVQQFLKDHPRSPAARYLLDKYLLRKSDADYKTAAKLAAEMYKAAPDLPALERLDKLTRQLSKAGAGGKLPPFSAKDIKKRWTDNSLMNGELNVIYVWASWNYESGNMQRKLNSLKKSYGSRLGLIGVSVDAKPDDAIKSIERDSFPWNIVCDGKMWNSPILRDIGLEQIPGNVVTNQSGNILARDLTPKQLEEKIKERLK